MIANQRQRLFQRNRIGHRWPAGDGFQPVPRHIGQQELCDPCRGRQPGQPPPFQARKQPPHRIHRVDIHAAGQQGSVQRLLVRQCYPVCRCRHQCRPAATDQQQKMILSPKGCGHLGEGSCRIHPARIRHRMGAGETAHAINLGESLIMRDNNAWRVASRIPHGPGHGRTGLANGDHMAWRRIKCGHGCHGHITRMPGS